jgi:hypothetical protein
MREAVLLRTWTPGAPPEVVPSALGDDAALVAAEWALGVAGA